MEVPTFATTERTNCAAVLVIQNKRVLVSVVTKNTMHCGVGVQLGMLIEGFFTSPLHPLFEKQIILAFDYINEMQNYI